eukprot:m.167528 g.167528  ORF g.167528 m.167528 type:complete len:1197 (+) comp12839_c0_seq1:59-3649(+)
MAVMMSLGAVMTVFASQVAGGGDGPSALTVNGLGEVGLAVASFPSTEALIVGWAPPPGTSTTGFEVQLTSEAVPFPPTAQRLGSVRHTDTGFPWTSGDVTSNASSFELPSEAMALLTDGHTYALRVRVRTSGGGASPWSTVTFFDTAPSSSAWAKASWIGGGSELRSNLSLPSQPIRARAYVTGVGVSELWINGAKVGNHYLDPGEAVYDQAVLFVSHNVTQVLQAGENSIQCKIGNSKYGYLDIYVNRTALHDQSGDSSRALMLIMQVELADGSVKELVTDTSGNWQARHGPIVYDHLWHGEIYDARQETETWFPAKAMPVHTHALRPQMMEGIKVAASYSPVETQYRSNVCDAPFLGGSAMEGSPLYLGCQGGRGTIASIEFASYGTPVNAGDANCSTLAANPGCQSNPATTLQTVKRLCEGKAECTLSASSELFGGDPCPNTVKTLSVRARASADCVPTVPPTVMAVNKSVLLDFGHNMAGFTTLTFKAPHVPAGVTVQLRLEHTEITGPDGDAYNNYYPGMEFNHASATCSMVDWYQRKWYECANQTDAFVFDMNSRPPGSTITYTPTFTYHGFRHVKLTAVQLLSNGQHAPLDGDLAAAFPFDATLVAHRVHSGMKQVGGMSLAQSPAASASEVATAGLLESIFNATLSSHVSNVYSIPTDCPQREKRGWMGDAGISSSSLQTFYDAMPFHVNFLRLIRDAQRKMCINQPQTTIYGPCGTPDQAAQFNGSVPDVTPFATGPYGGNPGTTDWQAAYVMVAWASLVHQGDLALPMLRDLWDSLDLFMDYLDRRSDNATGLLLAGARGDWVPPESQPFHTSAVSVAAFTHTLCVSHMADIATALGRTADASRYSKRLSANRKAYHTYFFNGDTPSNSSTTSRCCYGVGSQADNIFALQLGVVPPEHLDATLAMLTASINNHLATHPDDGVTTTASQETATSDAPTWGTGPHMDVGIFGTTWFFDVLRAHELDSVALGVLNETTYPSFGYMISQGATTLWEAWDGTAHTIGGGGTSRNHIMFGGGVNRYLAQGVGGLGIDARPSHPHTSVDTVGDLVPGWRHLVVKPAPAATRMLGQASAYRTTPIGQASVAWRNAGGYVHLNVTVPSNAVATVSVPLLDIAVGARVALGGASETNAVMACSVRCTDALEVVVVEESALCQRWSQADAVCRVRRDGERVLDLHNVEAGEHTFTAL